MTAQMTRWERVGAALEGGELDRPPVSAWRHFYRRETTAHGLADAMLAFQREHGWDFMKVNPRASYHSEDWGVRLRFSGSDSQDETNLWLREGAKITAKAVIGGVSHRTLLLEGSPEQVADEALWTRETMEGTRWLLGPGCTFSPEVPEANLRALGKAFNSGE